LALQSQEVDERRLAATPKVELLVEYISGETWVLRNVGGRTAEGVTVDTTGMESVLSHTPSGTTLTPGAGHQFMIATSLAQRDPTHILVTWAGQEDPVSLPVRK
jgi:hypothetical protein